MLLFKTEEEHTEDLQTNLPITIITDRQSHYFWKESIFKKQHDFFLTLT